MLNGAIAEHIKLVNHIVPASRTVGATNGTGIDTAGADRALFQFAIGDIGASTTLDAKIQESDDNSSWADISGAAITQLVAADDNKLPSIEVRLGVRNNRKRYLRAVYTVGGANAVVGGCVAALEMRSQPVTQTVAAVLV